MNIRKAAATDIPVLTELALQLWPEHTKEDMRRDLETILRLPDAVFFLAYAEEKPVGFAQCQLRRDYVEGTESSPVGYLEGIFVASSHRGKGVARHLLDACEDWAQKQGCREFASDCELDNWDSLQFHLRTGFLEANRIICFTKRIQC